MSVAVTVLTFLAAVGLPLVFGWVRRRRWGLPVRVTIDPEDPQPADIARYLAEIAQRLDARPERMRVRFAGRNTVNRAITLDLESDGALRLTVAGERPRRVDLRGRWIADHPVPLDLRHALLYVEPVDANRFRVMSRVTVRVPVLVYVACSLAATVAVILFSPILLAAALGLACGSALLARGI